MALLDNLIYFYNSITPFQAAISLSVIFLYILHLFLRDLDVPPGPKGLPLLGYWPFLSAATCHLQLKKLTEKYGDVFSIRSAGTLFIHLCSHKDIREAHVTKSEHFERTENFTLFKMLFPDGVILANGEKWKVLRKFFVRKFQEYGMNAVKENASCSIYDALKDSVEELNNSKGRPIQVSDLGTMQCLKIIRRIMFNDRGIQIKELQELNDEYAVLLSGVTSTNSLLIGNFVKYFLFPFIPAYWVMKRRNQRIEEILYKVVERHKSEYDDANAADLIDCFLKEREDRRKKGDPTAAYFTDKSLVNSLSQFVTDGVLTVGLAIGVFLSTLIEHPDVQEKIYEEILEVVGPNRLPSMEDKAKLKYTNAFIYEVFRYTDFFPLFPSLECKKETSIRGYKIPEGSVTLINLYAAHRNPETYENPDEFNPLRFLPTADKPRAELPIIFGTGKRSCIGEGYSTIQIFLLVTTIVQNFRLTFPKGMESPDQKFWSMERIQICAIPRSQKVDGKQS